MRHIVSQVMPCTTIIIRHFAPSVSIIADDVESALSRIASRAFVQSGFNEVASQAPAAPSRQRDLTEPSRFPNQDCSDSTCWLGWRPVWMGKPYSMDLRERVVAAVESLVASQRGLIVLTAAVKKER